MRVPSWPVIVVLLCLAPAAAAQAPRGRLPRLEPAAGQPPAGQPASGGSPRPIAPVWPGAAPGAHPRGVPGATGAGPGRGARPRVIVVGVPLWYAGYGFGLAPWHWWAGAPLDAATASAARTAPPPVPPTRVIEVGAAAAPNAGGRTEPRPVEAEPLAGGLLRVRWTGSAPALREVTLLVADAAGRTLAARTVRDAPWQADFAHTARVAFVGVAVPREDGGRTTTLLPLAHPGRGAHAR